MGETTNETTSHLTDNMPVQTGLLAVVSTDANGALDAAGASGTAGLAPHTPGDPAQLRAQIEQTRAGMSDTLSALQEKINPERLKEDAGHITDHVTEQVKEQAHETVGIVSEQVRETVQALTEHVKVQVEDTVQTVTGRVTEQAQETVRVITEQVRGQVQETVQSVTEQVKEQAHQTIRSAGEEARTQIHETVQAAQVAVHDATIGKVQNMLHNTTEAIKDVAHTAGEKLQAVGETISDKAHDVGQAVGFKAHVAGEAVADTTHEVVAAASDTAHAAGVKAHDAGVTAKATGASMLDTIKQNPIPAAMVGLGLTWLLMHRSGSQGSSQVAPLRSRSLNLDFEPELEFEAAQPGRTAGAAVRETVAGAQETAGHLADQAQAKAGQLADQTQDRVERLGDQVQQGAARAESRFQQTLQESPLAVGAVGLALGTAVGLIVPNTRAEDKLMGATHDKVMQKAGAVAHDTVEKVQQVAGEAKRAAQKEAEYQGLVE